MIDKEIIEGFREETKSLLTELEACVESLEETETEGEFPKVILEEFAQKIDRIMGAAKTLFEMDSDHQGLSSIGKLAELCKGTGYQAAQTGNNRLIPVFAAFWADTVEIVNELVEHLENQEATKKVISENVPTLQKRLVWLKERVNQVLSEGGQAVPVDDTQSQVDIDALMKEFGT